MHTVELTGGTIHYETVGPQNGRPIVFIHGFAMGASLWRPLSERLARQGLRCIAPTWTLAARVMMATMSDGVICSARNLSKSSPRWIIQTGDLSATRTLSR